MLLNEVPLFEWWQRLLSTLRESDFPEPIVRVKELMEPMKRKRGHKLKRPIFIPGKHEGVVEWSPSLNTAVDAKDLRRRKFRAFGTGEQALVSAFPCNRFLGKKRFGKSAILGST